MDLERMRDGFRLTAGFARAWAAGRPFILSHLLTGRCNARCPTCLWRTETVTPASGAGGIRGPTGAELSTGETISLYRSASAAGLVQLVVWGGEPTLRADLPRLLFAAKDAGLLVTLISNGWLLPERWSELRGSMDALILSVDDVGEAHDRLRGVPGLFRRIGEFVGATAADPSRPRLILNTVLSSKNAGALPRVARLAQSWHAGLYFCPMETGVMEEAGFADRRGSLALSPVELRTVAREALDLKSRGYPLLSTDEYLRRLLRDPNLTDYTCRVPAAIVTVDAEGGVRDCLRRDRPLADVRGFLRSGSSFDALYRLPRFREMVDEGTSCTVCNNPDVLETSWLWSLRPAMLRKVLQLASL